MRLWKSGKLLERIAANDDGVEEGKESIGESEKGNEGSSLSVEPEIEGERELGVLVEHTDPPSRARR